ncbi:MAG TPA: response regulator [Phycisphaerae bacterium]|nr:response regulator [Phycisphaerae bacterium]HRY69087.1 response regulator [Phycisphaerae bacterium]HSA25938.1 response regulator [Phycisphaerae bacterium]
MRVGKTILVVEDEADLAKMLRFNLEREGYNCRCVADGREAVANARRDPPDLLLLDRMLPGISGDEVLQQLKREPLTATIPTIMLTAKSEETDALVGFALGADDYVTKPFSIKVLLARIAALFRRTEPAELDSEVLAIGPIRLDSSRHELHVNGQSVSLTAMEFRVLRALMGANGRVLSRGQLIESTLGMGVAVTDRAIDVHITALRKKLGEAAAWVQTVRGVGYTFREPIESET